MYQKLYLCSCREGFFVWFSVFLSLAGDTCNSGKIRRKELWSCNNLETESIDPELEAHYEKILEEWKKDEDYRKGMLDKIIREVGNVGKKVDDLAVVPNKGWWFLVWSRIIKIQTFLLCKLKLKPLGFADFMSAYCAHKFVRGVMTMWLWIGKASEG